ncbi:MAG: hexameric tyrosine-coordinated heme protein [Burkholderiaceae bacterium]
MEYGIRGRDDVGRSRTANDPDSLVAVSHVIAVHFQTIAAANDYWRD